MGQVSIFPLSSHLKEPTAWGKNKFDRSSALSFLCPRETFIYKHFPPTGLTFPCYIQATIVTLAIDVSVFHSARWLKEKTDPIPPSTHSRWIVESSMLCLYILTAERLPCCHNTQISTAGFSGLIQQLTSNRTISRSASVQPQWPYIAGPC